MKFNKLILLSPMALLACKQESPAKRPNFLIVYTDDQRFDAVGVNGNEKVITPNMDKLFSQGMNFQQACVVTSICSPSRAAMLTGRYGSANGIVTVGHAKMNAGEQCLPQMLKESGYYTGQVGKWHIGDTPAEVGFDYYKAFFSNGSYYQREVNENGTVVKIKEYIEKYIASASIDFLEIASKKSEPWMLWMCTQVPHMDHTFDWEVKDETLARYKDAGFEVPESYTDDLNTKPPYLKTNRSHMRAIDMYHYNEKDSLLGHINRYYSAVTEMDEQLGRVLNYLKENNLEKNTYVILMGDNGWFNGEHQFTSKVLAYEESVRVPFMIKGPTIEPGVSQKPVLNIDIAPTVLDYAKLQIPAKMHGASLRPLLEENVDWRKEIFYEAPVTQLGSCPLYAIRTSEWKYILTYDNENTDSLIFEELYNLVDDPVEMVNLNKEEEYTDLKNGFKSRIVDYRAKYRN